MASDGGGASGAIWALATLLIVLIVLAALYFGGAFGTNKSVDVNINKPGVVTVWVK